MLGTDPEDPYWVRDSVDRLVLCGVLRRGLVLRCPDCATVQFSTIESGVVTTTCTRCAANIPITRATWKHPTGEVSWFYDLQPVVRRLLTDAGDIAILAGRQLVKDHRSLTFAPESDFINAAGVRTEIDLIAGNQQVVIVGECKATADIPSNERKKKIAGLITAAQVLRADEIVLAAGDEGAWPEPLVRVLDTNMRGATWPAGARPRLRLLTGLRTSTPRTEVVGNLG